MSIKTKEEEGTIKKIRINKISKILKILNFYYIYKNLTYFVR